MLFISKLFFSNALRLNRIHFSEMSVFVQKLNPITGINDWVVQNESYDYHQEVARSAFADMLHDTERNQLYEKALKDAIDRTHAKGKNANVLDIGTGTGLLSMMAARNGADSVIACEAFKPMSDCALKIIELNGFQDRIRVIPKRSTDLTVGEGGDLRERCNILVTEVFDTELIGEGALSTFSHAHKNLLERDSIVVPESATIYAQVVECPLVQNWNKVKDVFDMDGESLIKVPESIKNCAGSTAVHDIQLSQLPLNSFNTIVAPLPVLRFDWSGRTPFIYERSTINTVKAKQDGKAQAVFMWWELQMDTEGKIILSCAPCWAHPASKTKNDIDIPWRDHWMQAVYYLPKEVSVHKDQEINLLSCHDEYSLWFNLVEDLRISNTHYLNPICECGIHITFSRTRIGQMNDSRRNKKYIALLEKYVNSESQILVVSDGFFLALSAAKLGAKNIFFVETNRISRNILEEYIKVNRIENVTVIPSLDNLKEVNLRDVNIVLGEPYYITSILPWDNLMFLYLLKGMTKFVADDAQIFPKKAHIRGVAVHFKDLFKIRSPLRSCEGFLMKNFDELIEESCKISDDNVEAQPLWEYPGRALSSVADIAEIDLINIPEESLEHRGIFHIQGNMECNGIALWVDWNLDDSPDSTITTGPIRPIEIGKNIHWDMYTRQGVCLFPGRNHKEIEYNFKFDFHDGNITFKCL
ncbi:arginine methyltransferase 7 [Leptinotarsa decemlineata]|uniref:arginine methyltransferase 7 n=1 Tax=Leptinotarsa decemlineata TaxID=7539 RepID=UPI003D308280